MIYAVPVALGDATPSFDYLLNFGVLGLVMLALLTGFLWPKPSVDRVLKDKEIAEAQRDAMLQVYEQRVIPLLSEVQSKMIPALADMAGKISDLERVVDRLSDDVRRGT